MKNHFYALAFVFLLPLFLAAQEKPSLEAIRIDGSLKIDGILDDPQWEGVPIGDDFTNLQPVPDIKPQQKSEVKVVYNDDGFYVGVMMYDANPDSIQMELTERDNLGNTDWIAISLDPYNSGTNGFAFLTTPANVQFDSQYSANGEDENWDAVWQSKSVLLENGWSVEYFIPYSAIRFPKTNVQEWTINFVRRVQRNQEKSFWTAIDPNIDGYLNQCGKLTGLRNIKAPLRIQATPFLAVYGLSARAAGVDKASTGSSVTGGMDIKVGLSEAFTLDMTLIPDFGEARSDDQILNLGPFEQRFDEQRAFFTEGTELFNKGGFFYSRRVGGGNYFGGPSGQMADGEVIVDNPQRAKLYNATKITGRTAKGTGIGFFNAVEKANYATVRSTEGDERQILTNPLTNYNVAVIDQNLKNNSSVTLINTNVMREGDAPDANVTGLLFDIHNNENKYSIAGNVGYSQRFLQEETSTGHKGNLRISKISGNWTWTLGYGEESDTYDPNDLGILFANNERRAFGRVRYNYNEPFFKGFFLNGGAGTFIDYEKLYKPGKFTGSTWETWVYSQTKHFWNLNFWVETSLGDNFDYFEPRVKGRVLRNPGERTFGGWVGTDNRKKIRLNGNFNSNGYYGADRSDLYINLNARYRVSPRFSLNAGVFRGKEKNEVGYVNRATIDLQDGGSRTDIYMGQRDVTSVEASFSGKYSFSANMTLNLRVRHYWSGVAYNEFNLLEEDGSLGTTDYANNHDQDFDAFNVDLIYRWRFAPGSDMFVVYKSNITDFDLMRSESYGNSFQDLWKDTPRSGSISLKVVYWLDYASIVK